jgi:glycosyltransferase involved in cell wall biosynthesis
MILFVGHEASLTGAPVLLLDIIRQIKAKTNWEIEVLLRKGGDLLPDYQKVAPTKVWKLPEFGNPSVGWKIRNKLFGTFAKKRQDYIQQFANKNVQLIFSNTCTNGELLEQLSYLKCPIISHVHELEGVIQIFNENDNVKKNFQISNRILAGSIAVQDNLIAKHAVPPAKIEVVYGAIVTQEDKVESENIRESLNIPEDAFLVGACGVIDYRKGYDLFLQVAYEILHRKKIRNIYFMWVGYCHHPSVMVQVEKEVNLMQLSDFVRFTGKKAIKPYLKTMDLMITPSREEPFGLVNLEAGMFRKTVICFEHCGGTPEILSDNCGFMVPYLNILEMANKIIELKENPELRKKVGENLYQKVKKNFSIEHISDQIIDQINKSIKSW